MTARLDTSGLRRLPVLLAAQATECGPVCLAMIARYHGLHVDLLRLREHFIVSMKGVTLQTLARLATEVGLTSRAVKADIEALPHLALPAIIHWDLNHFVVLKAIGRGQYLIHDPAIGERHIDAADFSRHYTGIALELRPAGSFAGLEGRQKLRLTDLWSNLTGAGHAFGHLIALSIGLQLIALVLPFQMQLIVDQAIFKSDFDLLSSIAIAFGALVVFQAVIAATRAWSIQLFGVLLSYQVMGNLVGHLFRLPSKFFETRHVGDIISRLGSAEQMKDVLLDGGVSAIIDGTVAVLAAVILFFYSPMLALIVLAGVTLQSGATAALYPLLRVRMHERIVHKAREQTNLMESVRAATIIKIMGREQQRENLWRNLYTEVANATLRVGKVQVSLSLIQSLVTGVVGVIVVYLGARLVMEGQGFSIGMLVAFLSFQQTLTDRANVLINTSLQLRALELHLDRLSDVVLTKADSVEGNGSDLAAPTGSISFRNVSYRYGTGERAALRNVSFDIAAGEFVAFTGPSGGGKSTLIKLLLGLLAPTEGEILLDGQPASAATWRHWRDHMGVVFQDDRLVSGSIADNIAFFESEISMNDVRAAASAAKIDLEIARMPMQYMSLVGDMGSALSGGQKQRLLLARALYRRPSILVMDEGTANLDLENEAAIADLVASFPVTRIVVAHRRALLDRADKVLVIEEGALVELVAAKPQTMPA